MDRKFEEMLLREKRRKLEKAWDRKERKLFPNDWQRRERRANARTEKDKPGFLYFFRTVTGWYKLGRTEDWIGKRWGQYTGPAKPERIFFVRPVKRMRQAESTLKDFVMGLEGFTSMNSHNEWYLKERTAAARFHRKGRPRRASSTG